ncbi:FUSC family protein [Actinomycetospora corticicola]|uniref:Uncharacterized membrane protein YgaE (UPF0421/DUF939 family) n=1 Tax=Actinomycetospora corticicola TaxID=663602 RepID=A0A7Y9DZ25_9PSEU|nr:FUSC family protein [Actinomycetospora corticicola]NYD38111.1 uncharacterized membrane protein YgaE (UPF0421/DUF939 family) [Actinomycetospora corticicola]
MSRLGTFLDTRRRRLRDSAWPVLQCALAAGAAFAIARHVVGHPVPFFAPIACVLVLGISLTNRLRRSVELAVGVSVGVGVGDAIVLVIGSGWWQIAVVVALALLVALLFDVGALLLNQAAVSAVLVATLQPPGTSAAFSRWLDTLIGAALGLLVAAVLPSNPLTAARRTVDTLLDELSEALRGAAESLEAADPETGNRVLERIRASQRAVDAFDSAVDAGLEITAIAPGRRRHRGELSRLRAATGPLDLAVRNARVLVRRAVSAATDGETVGAEVAPDPARPRRRGRRAAGRPGRRAPRGRGRDGGARRGGPAPARRWRVLRGRGRGPDALDRHGPAVCDGDGPRRRPVRGVGQPSVSYDAFGSGRSVTAAGATSRTSGSGTAAR